QALEIRTSTLGKFHPDVAESLHNLASHYADRGDWRQAYDLFNRATSILINRRAETFGGEAAAEVRIHDDSSPFFAAIPAAYKLAEGSDRSTSDILGSRAFESAQWVSDDRAASAIAGMSARIAAGGGDLSALVRERQDLNEQALALDRTLIAAASQDIHARNLEAEKTLQAQASNIVNRVNELDRLIAVQFPGYSTLVAKNPLPTTVVQGLLQPNEALILFAPTAHLTVVWTITRSEVRWHAAPMEAKALAEKVAILRCGLDAAAWEGSTRCADKLGLVGVSSPSKPLPFDIKTAHELYQALF